MCYLLTFIFNQTEGQSHQSLNTLTAPRPSPFRRWVSIRGGGPDLVRAMKSHAWKSGIFSAKGLRKKHVDVWNPLVLNDMDIFCWREKNPLTCWFFSCSEKVTQNAGKLTSSVPYHEDRCLPPKLNPPPLINKAFPLNTSVLQTWCIFVQHLLLASQNGPTVYIPVVTK